MAEVVHTILKDDELNIQLIFSTSQVSSESDFKPTEGAIGFLSIILYGPKRRSDDVGYFMTKCGWYLEDPVGCDQNVPYMNPQCLFQFYEEPIMTFDLPELAQQGGHEFSRTPVDILAGFETTDCFQEASSPSALATNLKP